MATPSVGAIVLIPFPFSDLSHAKRRPAVVLAEVGRNDFVLCQITSNPYADANAIEIVDSSFVQGGLLRVSYVRPGKLFTANENLIIKCMGMLRKDVHKSIVEAVVNLIRTGL